MGTKRGNDRVFQAMIAFAIASCGAVARPSHADIDIEWASCTDVYNYGGPACVPP
jgi:hypothetical protein